MTFHLRIKLDRILAVPLCFICDMLARALGPILRRDHSVTVETTREIVVAKLVGMGSILQATPLLRALKSRFPNARMTFLTLEANRDLVSRLSEVDEVLTLDDRGICTLLRTTIRTLFVLIRRRVDLYFDLELYSGFASLLALVSLARNRLGLYRHSRRAKKGIYTHLVYFNTRMPVRRIYLQLGRTAGVPPNPDDRLGVIRIQPEERQSLKQKLAILGMPPEARYLLINPNASALLMERRWPESHVVTAIARLAILGHTVALLGSADEADFVNGLIQRLPDALRPFVINTAGRLTLGEALALIDGACCVLTNDTGPMHMAFALNRPTVCLMGPTDPAHYGMLGPRIVSFYAPVPCSPCVHEVDQPPCLGHNVCMERIDPEEVVKQILDLIASEGGALEVPPAESRGAIIRLPLVWDTETGQPLGSVVRAASQGH